MSYFRSVELLCCISVFSLVSPQSKSTTKNGHFVVLSCLRQISHHIKSLGPYHASFEKTLFSFQYPMKMITFLKNNNNNKTMYRQLNTKGVFYINQLASLRELSKTYLSVNCTSKHLYIFISFGRKIKANPLCVKLIIQGSHCYW
jgi:hypothetical protein